MLTIGIILVVIGALVAIPALTTVGVILAVVGAIFWLLGSLGRPVGRAHYW